MSPFSRDKYPRARPAAWPRLVSPSLPSLARAAPAGEPWIHEIKLDGYRMLAHFRQQTPEAELTFFSRNGRDWSSRLPSLAAHLKQLPCASAILDGEVVMLDENGASNFQALQNRIGAGRDGELLYYVFDLLYLDGFDLTPLLLSDRKELLAALLHSHTEHVSAPQRVFLCEHLTGHGPTILQHACQLGVEGIVSKRLDKRYLPGRTDAWIKTKCLKSGSFVVGGFTYPTASRQGIGALLLGEPVAAHDQVPHGDLAHEKNTSPDHHPTLRYVGKVGTGFSDATLMSLRNQLQLLRRAESPFVNLDRRTADKGTVWVQPELIAEIEFGGWTDDQLIRFGSYRGLRDDLSWDDVTSEFQSPSSVSIDCSSVFSAESSNSLEKGEGQASDRNYFAQQITEDLSAVPVHASLIPQGLTNLRLTHPDRVVYPDLGITKLGVASYYAQVAPWMLPHLVGRPLSLYRCPDGLTGKCFFQKRAPRGLDPSVERVELTTKEGARPFLIVHDVTGLLSLVQFGVLEFHVWGSRYPLVDICNRIVFDLDPAENLPWERVRWAAFELRAHIEKEMGSSFVKTTGGRGLHIVIPLKPGRSWDEAQRWSRAVAELFVQRYPESFTTNTSLAARRNKILIDVQRNTRGATTVAPYSTRARRQGSVSVPIGWEELSGLSSSNSMTMSHVLRRLASSPHDPWGGIAGP